MERLGARDLPWVMWALRSLMGRIGMTVLSAMGFPVGGGFSRHQYAVIGAGDPIRLKAFIDMLCI